MGHPLLQQPSDEAIVSADVGLYRGFAKEAEGPGEVAGAGEGFDEEVEEVGVGDWVAEL